jgi:hypothetical protein
LRALGRHADGPDEAQELSADRRNDLLLCSRCRQLRVTPHVAQNSTRPGGSAIDARAARRHAGKPKRPPLCQCRSSKLTVLIVKAFVDLSFSTAC